MGTVIIELSNEKNKKFKFELPDETLKELLESLKEKEKTEKVERQKKALKHLNELAGILDKEFKISEDELYMQGD